CRAFPAMDGSEAVCSRSTIWASRAYPRRVSALEAACNLATAIAQPRPSQENDVKTSDNRFISICFLTSLLQYPVSHDDVIARSRRAARIDGRYRGREVE